MNKFLLTKQSGFLKKPLDQIGRVWLVARW